MPQESAAPNVNLTRMARSGLTSDLMRAEIDHALARMLLELQKKRKALIDILKEGWSASYTRLEYRGRGPQAT
jgi:ParB-like chromosome segregation protein Spo0J